MDETQPIVRPLLVEDTDKVFKLVARVRQEAYADMIPADYRREFIANHQENEGNLTGWRSKIHEHLADTEHYKMLILEEAGEIRGYAAAKIGPKHDFITNFYIDTSFQGKGYGKRLFKGLMADLSGRAVRLHVLKANQGAISFYENLGFKITGSAKQDYYGTPKWVMSKPHNH